MEIKSIETQDTHGILMSSVLKFDPTVETVAAWFDLDEDKNRVISVSPNNINFAISNGPKTNITYKQVLQYNGTLSSDSSTYQQILKDETMIAENLGAPVLTYSPDGLQIPDAEDIDNIVVDLAFHTGLADVLEFKQGALTRGGKTYNVAARHSYPTIIKELPNVDGKTVYIDGWYTYTFIRFVDVDTATTVSEGSYYSYRGQVFRASSSGAIYIANKLLYIIPARYFAVGSDTDALFYAGNYGEEMAMEDDSKASWEDLRINLNSRDGLGDNYNHSYVDSQLLVTDEIRDAITEEILCAATADKTSICDMDDWQQLILKRMSAYIMFENGLFRNAQTIIESSRRLCKFRPNRGC